MSHIHTQPGQYDLTVSAYIVRRDGLPTAGPVDSARPVLDDAPTLLLHRHKTLGVWMQPGGHVELDETPWQAIAHELREETGYDLDQLQVLQPVLRPPAPPGDVQHPQPVCLRSFPFGVGTNHFHTDLTFAFLTDAAPHHEVGQGESHQFAWVTRQQLDDLPAEQTYEDIRQLGLYIFDQLLAGWVPMPATNFLTTWK